MKAPLMNPQAVKGGPRRERTRQAVLDALEELGEARVAQVAEWFAEKPGRYPSCEKHVGTLIRELELQGRVTRRLVPQRGGWDQRVTVSLWRIVR